MINKEEICKNIIKETGLELREVQLLLEKLIYVTIYYAACTLAGLEQYSLAIDICSSLLKYLNKVEG